MAKKSAQIDAYIAKSADFAKPILNHLRRVVLAACPQAEETLKWGCPHFVYGGKMLCSMAAFKQHCKFGFWHQAMHRSVSDAEKAAGAHGLFGHVTKLSDLPSKMVLTRLIKQAQQLTDDGIKSNRPKSKPKKPVTIPSDLKGALGKNKKALAAFENLSPSPRREYVEWIVEAKRPETRLERLQTTVRWLIEGKSRYWKYGRK